MLDICYNTKVDKKSWKDYIENKYLEWRADKRGQAGSAASFSRELNITRQLLGAWMDRGQVPNDQELISKLVNYFGFEVYDVLGLPRPTELDKLPKDFADRLNAAHSGYMEEIASRGISKDSPEALEIFKNVLAKHGIHFTDTE